MSTDSGLFATAEELEDDGWTLKGNVFARDGWRKLPLYEAKMLHHFDHRYGDYAMRQAGSQDTQLPDVAPAASTTRLRATTALLGRRFGSSGPSGRPLGPRMASRLARHLPMRLTSAL